MPVICSESQGDGDGRNLTGFYTPEPDALPGTVKGFAAMRRLIKRLCDELAQTDVWLLTSHDRLVLMDCEEYDEGDWHVMISAYDSCVTITFKLPNEYSLFPDSEVVARAFNDEEAFSFSIVAMLNSSGWSGAPELKTRAEQAGAVQQATRSDLEPLWRFEPES